MTVYTTSLATTIGRLGGMCVRTLIGCALVAAAGCSRGQIARAPASGDSNVVLNHVVAILDAATIDAIEKSSFLREHFASAEQRTNATADGRSWTGFYLYGRETCVEFFGPGPENTPGEGGVGLGVDGRGELEKVASRLRAEGRAFEWHLVTKRESNGKEIPWFTSGMFLPNRPEAPFGSWLMEYRPEYMMARLAGKQHDPNDVSRRSYLSIRYVPDRWVENVLAAHFRVPARERDEFAETFAAYGWRVVRQGEDAVAVNRDTELRVTADTGQSGLVEMRFTLNRNVERQEVTLGNSTLIVGPGPYAAWRFTPVRRAAP